MIRKENPEESAATDSILPLSLLYSFTNKASSATEIQSLMTHFFNSLKTEVNFDIGSYMLCYEGYAEGRLYKKVGIDAPKTKDFSRIFLKRARKFSPDFTPEMIDELQVSILMDKGDGSDITAGGREVPAHSLELPLLCWGEPSGVITLISFEKENPFGNSGLFSEMIKQVNRVLERLLSSIASEDAKIAHILNHITEGVLIVDQNFRLTAANPKSLEIVSNFCKHHIECVKRDFGIGEFLPDKKSSCQFTSFLSMTKELDSKAVGITRTKEIQNEEGTTLVLTLNQLNPEEYGENGFTITAKDITDERMAQKGALLSSKLASLGEMAAGIAHEINNPLQAILGNIEMLGTKVNESEQVRVERIQEGVLRIRTIVNDLLGFARDQTSDKKTVALNDVINKCIDIFGSQLEKSGVTIKTDLDTKPLMLEVNPNLLQQVIINLVQNARDAIVEAHKGSSVTIRTALLPDRQIAIEVSDDGPGIPEAIIGKIFNPLFTTKEVGKGTGLGLSLSKKIVEGFDGTISVKSTRQNGTTFRISLPQCGPAEKKERRGRRAGDVARKEPNYSKLVDKKVLMVDDEVAVLSTASEALSNKLFETETVSDSKEALKKVIDTDYDFIFLDIKMPGMDGFELYRKIVGHKPHMVERIVFLTADVDNPRTAEFLRLTQSRYLKKPFSVKELLAVMCEIADKAKPRTKLRVLKP